MERAQLQPLLRPPPDNPTQPMEFLSRSWSVSALQISNALPDISGNPFTFASSHTSRLVMDRIMLHSQEASPRTSVRLSHSTDIPTLSPSHMDDLKYFRLSNFSINQYKALGVGDAVVIGRGKTVGRWFKDKREKKKEEVRTHNAQLHAAISVACLASAVAAIASATAASSEVRRDEHMSKTDKAVASAATLVASQCIEAAEAMGTERDHLASVVNSAVNVRSAGDIMTLMAAAATALHGAATLKGRTSKDVWNIAAVTPVDKAIGLSIGGSNGITSFRDELVPEENFLGICSRGSELLKKTRKGDLHWKIVSVCINCMGQVILKMKSRHVAGTVTKKKKNVVVEVVRNIPAWAGRHLLEGGEHRMYFGLKTLERGVVEFECRNQREYDVWTRGVSRFLAIAADNNNSRHRI